MAFDASKLSELTARVDEALRAELDQARAAASEDERHVFDGTTDTHFEVANLDAFEVSLDGVTFLYDYDFPHVVQALEPAGRFHFSWSEMMSYLSAHSPLTAIAMSIGGTPGGVPARP